MNVKYNLAFILLAVCLLTACGDRIQTLNGAVALFEANESQFNEIVSLLKSDQAIGSLEQDGATPLLKRYKDYTPETMQKVDRIVHLLKELDLNGVTAMRDDRTQELKFRGVWFDVATGIQFGGGLIIDILYLENDKNVPDFDDGSSCKSINDKDWYVCSKPR